MMNTISSLLKNREALWAHIKRQTFSVRSFALLILFIAIASSLYGSALAGWRSPQLSLYVAVKMPILFFGTILLVSLFNWMMANFFYRGLNYYQTLALTFCAMGVACWILLSLIPIVVFFMYSSFPKEGTDFALMYTHDCLLFINILLIAFAGITGNTTLLEGLRSLTDRKTAWKIYFSWLFSYAFVGAQLSWILRPFIGSPQLPVEFMRASALNGNFYEFVFAHLMPSILTGGK